MKGGTAALALALAIPFPLAGQSAWRAADSSYVWSFPQDHWAHPAYKTEWWYFTGVLADPDDATRRFGYQFTFFRVGLTPDSLEWRSTWGTQALVMGHASVSDLTNGTHVFSEVLFRPNGLLGGFGAAGDTLIAWSRAPYGTDGRWTLSWTGDGFAFQMRDDARGVAFALSTRPMKPLIFQGPNGFSRKGAGPSAASQYYSFTRLATEGTVTLDGVVHTVAGESWMDKEFGSNQLGSDQVGWDWLALRLDDGREVMLYTLRSEGGTSYARGTVVGTDGRVRYLHPSDWTLDVTATWRSGTTGAAYPGGWRLEIPTAGIAVDVVPMLADQENVAVLVPDLFYWEGAVTVRSPSGDRMGEGYVELTGYGTRTRPAI